MSENKKEEENLTDMIKSQLETNKIISPATIDNAQKSVEEKETDIQIVRVARKDRSNMTAGRLYKDIGYTKNQNSIMSMMVSHSNAEGEEQIEEAYDIQFKIVNPKKTVFEILMALHMRKSIIVEEIVDVTSQGSANSVRPRVQMPNMINSDDSSIMLWVSCFESNIKNTIQIVRLVTMMEEDNFSGKKNDA